MKSTFLNGAIKKEVFVEQPQGFIVEYEETKVYKLKKVLYDLKQSPRAWYSEINTYFKANGFQRSKSEPTLYVKTQGNSNLLIVSLYVDDLVFTGSDENMIEDFKRDMMNKYEMSDLGLLHYFLGIEVSHSEDGLFISQKKYTRSLLERFNMKDCKLIDTPMIANEKYSKDDGSKDVDGTLYRSLIGCLSYLGST